MEVWNQATPWDLSLEWSLCWLMRRLWQKYVCKIIWQLHPFAHKTDVQGDLLEENGVQGLLCLRRPTPGMCREIFGHCKSLKHYFNYFNKHPGSLHISCFLSALSNIHVLSLNDLQFDAALIIFRALLHTRLCLQRCWWTLPDPGENRWHCSHHRGVAWSARDGKWNSKFQVNV